MDLQEKDVEQISKSLLSDYADSIWSCSTSKLGYSGTAVLSRVSGHNIKLMVLPNSEFWCFGFAAWVDSSTNSMFVIPDF